MKIRKRRSKLKTALKIFMCCTVAGVVTLFGLNYYVKSVSADRIITAEAAANLNDVDCIVVLGCQVKKDGTPSSMLRDRLVRGIDLYNKNAAPKLLMSGDHGNKDYDEVGTMKQYAIDTGVPSSDVFMDHAGFSTYESIYRAKEIFGADKIVIVTQKYHLYRALYIAEKFDIEAYGVDCDYYTYTGQTKRECREILARVKDFITTIVKPKPTFLGEVVPVNGNGDITND